MSGSTGKGEFCGEGGEVTPCSVSHGAAAYKVVAGINRALVVEATEKGGQYEILLLSLSLLQPNECPGYSRGNPSGRTRERASYRSPKPLHPKQDPVLRLPSHLFFEASPRGTPPVIGTGTSAQ